MLFSISLGILTPLLVGVQAQAVFPALDVPATLNITALTGRNNVSVIECWQLTAELGPATVPGRIGSLALPVGNVTNAVYGVLPPRFVGGVHNAPRKQYVWWISGIVRFILPIATEGVPTEALIYGGKYGLIFADDTADISEIGHDTEYPGADVTIGLTIPTEGGVTPPHTVLHDGQCEAVDITGL